MLALMPQSPPLSLHTPATLAPGSMSVAILPSAPLACGPGSVAPQFSKSTAPSKRPKLSLNTVNVSATLIGRSTSLRLDTLSATSPTSRNTFQNRCSPVSHHVSTPSRLTLSPRELDESDSDGHESASQTEDSDYSDRASSSSSTSTVSSFSMRSVASTTESSPDGIPYQLAPITHSILNNGPIPRVRYRKPNKRMFPPRKTVSFRTPLTEDVKTCKYTLSNIDLEALSPNPEAQSPAAEDSSSRPSQQRREMPTLKIRRSHESLADDDDSLCPATPVAGKRKRDRQWVWTLGPTNPDETVDGNEPNATVEAAS